MATSTPAEKNEGEESQQNLWQAMLQRCSRQTSEADSHLIVLGEKKTPAHALFHILGPRENELSRYFCDSHFFFVQEVHTMGSKVYSSK